MRSFLHCILLFAFFHAIQLRADIITLTDGRTVEGEIVSESADEIVVKASVGKTSIKREEIQSIEKKKSASLTYREKIGALTKSKDNDKKEEWLSLGDQAKRAGASDEAVKAYSRVIQIDPDNVDARKALGFVRSGGNWVAKGDVKAKGEPAVKEAEPSGPMSKAQVAARAGVNDVSSIDEKPVPCPRCNGSGVYITLPCLNCNKSGKPGYKNLGDHFEMDQRCGGTGSIVAMMCELCHHTGKVLMSHIAPANGGSKAPPPGHLWCPVCHGTGIETWLPCNQCKRSKWPGILFMGDRVTECNSCGGAGKKPALDCANCKKTGLINATQTDPNKQYGIGVGPDKK